MYSVRYVQQAIAALKMEYIDLVLVGWVGASWRERSNHARDKILRRDSWRALSSAHADGLVRSIGLGILIMNLPCLHHVIDKFYFML